MAETGTPPASPAELDRVAARALALCAGARVIGLGSGRAATAFIRALGAEVKAGRSVRGVPTSEATARLARELGHPAGRARRGLAGADGRRRRRGRPAARPHQGLRRRAGARAHRGGRVRAPDHPGGAREAGAGAGKPPPAAHRGRAVRPAAGGAPPRAHRRRPDAAPGRRAAVHHRQRQCHPGLRGGADRGSGAARGRRFTPSPASSGPGSSWGSRIPCSSESRAASRSSGGVHDRHRHRGRVPGRRATSGNSWPGSSAAIPPDRTPTARGLILRGRRAGPLSWQQAVGERGHRKRLHFHSTAPTIARRRLLGVAAIVLAVVVGGAGARAGARILDRSLRRQHHGAPRCEPRCAGGDHLRSSRRPSGRVSRRPGAVFGRGVRGRAAARRRPGARRAVPAPRDERVLLRALRADQGVGPRRGQYDQDGDGGPATSARWRPSPGALRKRSRRAARGRPRQRRDRDVRRGGGTF